MSTLSIKLRRKIKNLGIIGDSFFALTYHIQSIRKFHWHCLQNYIRNLLSPPSIITTLSPRSSLTLGYFTKLLTDLHASVLVLVVWSPGTSHFVKRKSEGVTPVHTPNSQMAPCISESKPES